MQTSHESIYRSLSLETLVMISATVLMSATYHNSNVRCARSTGVIWLNPHAASSGYVPAARGMRAALSFITLLAAANDVQGFEELATRVTQTPRIRRR